MAKNTLTELYKELVLRGFDVSLLDILNCIAYKDGFQTSILLIDDDNTSWNGANIMTNHIALDNDLNYGEKLFVCNKFNNRSRHCIAYVSDSDEDLFILSAFVSANCENFIEICADVFEEVLEATEALIDLIEDF